ncbi:VIN3-like protein 2 [Tripterygium wilfordii]|uniref:VIN3-like protein 2 n=1 Tax=Tripterygium wilfordii TaxID=458696 RepID=A0A7J7D0H8_TRIWF|nr:VIN3-like protein 2 [Tripterygium wilfordii]
MASEFSGYVLDPAKCSQLSLTQKRKLVHQVALWSKDAPKFLSSFTRKELLEIICAEMGKERKYTGLNKSQMIKHLLELVSQKSKRSNNQHFLGSSPEKNQTGLRSERWIELQQLLSTDLNHVLPDNNKEEHMKPKVCQNAACRATLHTEDAFCKRCSCFICHQYDDNKDPSLWLTCSSDYVGENDSCGITCHLICALQERAGIMKIGCYEKLEGNFYCVSCGKVNGLMRVWRKQLLVAMEARRVDVLCLRVLLAYKILTGTEQYKKVQSILETALQLLKNEVGPLDLICANMPRGIVNRLSCSAEVQKLCASAVEVFDSMFDDTCTNSPGRKESASKCFFPPSTCQIKFEESSPTSVVLVLDCTVDQHRDFYACKLWHRKSNEKVYPQKPTSTGIVGVWEAKWVTPTSSDTCVPALCEREREENIADAETHPKIQSINSAVIRLTSGDHQGRHQSVKVTKKNYNGRLYSTPPLSESNPSMISQSISPSTPCKSNGMQEGNNKVYLVRSLRLKVYFFHWDFLYVLSAVEAALITGYCIVMEEPQV